MPAIQLSIAGTELTAVTTAHPYVFISNEDDVLP
jgi:hypothetical protein